MRDFNHTVNVLVKAYLNNTLQRSNCFACAVGNMIADSNNYIYCNRKGMLSWEKNNPEWQWVFVTISGEPEQFTEEFNYKDLSKEQIDSTGYTWQELAKIEYAFERNYKGEDPMFNSLMAVVDVLADIHNIDLKEREKSKLLFQHENI